MLDVVGLKTGDVINNRSWKNLTAKKKMRYIYGHDGRETNVAIDVHNNLRQDIITKLIDEGNFKENILPEGGFI